MRLGLRGNNQGMKWQKAWAKSLRAWVTSRAILISPGLLDATLAPANYLHHASARFSPHRNCNWPPHADTPTHWRVSLSNLMLVH